MKGDQTGAGLSTLQPVVSRVYRVFFSYGAEDRYVVKDSLAPKVKSSGAELFLDQEAIEFGTDFRQQILTALGACDELFVLLTPASIRSPWVLAEMGAVLVRGKLVVGMTYGVKAAELQKLGVLSLLGTTHLPNLNVDFDDYVEQLTGRVKEPP